MDAESDLVSLAADAIAKGGVVAWFQGRSELGQRALGSRSLLADPRDEAVRQRINRDVKGREWWRPLAPTVLAEEAAAWFHLGGKKGKDKDKAGSAAMRGNPSPYMQLTAFARDDKAALIPAVLHIDKSARLQTLTAEDSPLFHALVSAFFRLTGVPMLLNTSLNKNSQVRKHKFSTHIPYTLPSYTTPHCVARKKLCP